MNVQKALADAEPAPYWLEDPARPDPLPALSGLERCDLAVIGGGYSGLWTALLAKERHPSRDVVVVESDRIGGAASGRNGGFCAASITHGLGNGLDRWPAEIATLYRLGQENLDGIEAAVARYGMDCDFERTGEMHVATEPYQVEDLAAEAKAVAALGGAPELLDRDAVRAEVDSPTYQGGLWDRRGAAMVHPAKLAWGLREACLSLGVRLYERTPALSLRRAGAAMRIRTPYGGVEARRVAVGTGTFPPLVRRLRHYLVPVYDYALMTEPLTGIQRESLGWRNRQGVGDSANQFHYYRLTADNRILWGGYDAIYHYGNGISPAFDQRPETFRVLAEHFFATFPQLDGLSFTHRWGGVIDTCSRFCAFYGTAHGGRVAYAAGYTGLGVGATRFGADVMLDLLSGEETERTALEMVRTKPLPFPPEPFRYTGIELTRRSLASADTREGRRNLWLRTLDRLGLGFDS